MRDGQLIAVIQHEVDMEFGQPIPHQDAVDNDPMLNAEMADLRGHVSSEVHYVVDGMLPLHDEWEAEMSMQLRVSGRSPEVPVELTGDITVSIEATHSYDLEI